MSDRPECQGRWHWLLAPWVLLCVTLPAATGGCLRKASTDCDPQADSPQCFKGEICWEGTCRPTGQVLEADGGPTDTGTDTGEPDTRSVDADAGKKNDMSLEVVTEFDEPIDEATTVKVEVDPSGSTSP